jgi:hypothetical protein
MARTPPPQILRGLPNTWSQLQSFGAGANVTSTVGLQFNGVTQFIVGALGTPGGVHGQTIFIGPGAGAAFPLGTSETYGSLGIGADTFSALTSLGAECVGLGSWAGRVYNGSLATIIGMGAGGNETTAIGITLIGNDSMRDAIAQSGAGYIFAGGQGSLAHGAPASSVVALGSQSGHGISSGIILGGTKTTGDVLTITLTASGILGSPYTENYTILSGDTLVTIAANIAANLSGKLGASYPQPFEAFSAALPDGTHIIWMAFPGSDVTGWNLAITTSVSGGATETLTAVGGTKLSAATLVGNGTAGGTAGGVLSNITAIGDGAAGNLKTFSYGTFGGSSSANHLMTGTAVVTWGDSVFSASGLTGLSYSTGIGTSAGLRLTGAAASQIHLFGYGSGSGLTTPTANWLVLGPVGNTTTGAGASGVVLIGSGWAAVESPTNATSHFLNIENILTATGTNVPSTSVATIAGLLISGGAGFTVATLPAAATALKGARSFVTDATSPAYSGALTGGGAIVVPVFCNGSAWVSA